MRESPWATRSAGVPVKTIRPPSWPGARAEVDDPVGVRHDRLVVLDDDHRVAGVDQPVEQAEQLVDVGQVQAGGGLVQHVVGGLLGHVDGQLEPLAFAAGQRGQRLAEAEVAEADVDQPAEDRAGLRRSGRTSRASATDIASTSLMFLPRSVYVEHLVGEALALARLADARHAGHHRQVGVDQPDALAGRAGALGVGAEQGGLDAVGLGEGGTDRVEQPGVGGRVAASGAPDRGLVDDHDPGPAAQRPVDQRALAGAGDSGDHGEHPERDVHVTSRRLCRSRLADRQLPGGWRRVSSRGDPVVEVPAGERVGAAQPGDVAGEADPAAVACRRPARGRPRGRRSRWSPACARPPARCCPCRATAAAGRSSGRCRAGAGRRWARRRRT